MREPVQKLAPRSWFIGLDASCLKIHVLPSPRSNQGSYRGGSLSLLDLTPHLALLILLALKWCHVWYIEPLLSLPLSFTEWPYLIYNFFEPMQHSSKTQWLYARVVSRISRILDCSPREAMVADRIKDILVNPNMAT